MQRPLVILLIGIAFFGGYSPPVAGQLTPEAVREAIDRGVGFLKRQQKADGSWRDYPLQKGGVTALCTLALLNAGVPHEDPAVRKALEYLRKLPPEKTYTTSLQTMVFCRIDPRDPLRDRHLLQRNVEWLQKHQISSRNPQGAWSYPDGDGDNSNSQFAMLALYEAERVGVPVRAETWRLAKTYWEGCQNSDGSWGYIRGQPGSGSMTTAGITSLVIAADRVGAGDAAVEGNQIKCCQEADAENTEIRRALEWLRRHFSVEYNPHMERNRGSVWLFYYLYGLERVGRMTAHRFIGEHDWYREGADFVLKLKSGPLADHWAGTGPAEGIEEVSTSFALLFLCKGRWPVLVSKVKHGRGNDWNQHRNDVGNLTHFVETRWKRDLVWQVVDIGQASIDDLIQSPVLYYCGSQSPLPDDPDQQRALAEKLRGYLDRGGFLFAEGYCGGAAFDAGFRKLMGLVFPEREYQLRVLPPEHPIWHMEESLSPEHVRSLLGVEFGCRTSVVYCPPEMPSRTLSCLWELSRPGRDHKYPKEVRAHVDAGLVIGLNVLAYATNREMKTREQFFTTVPQRAKGDKLARGKLYVANLLHPGGCNSAPRALTNLLESSASNIRLRVQTPPEDVSITDAALFDYHLVFMHGRNSFRLTDAERKQLKAYVERGGMIFADSICASKAFTESFRREMQAIFPEQPLKPIPADDPLLTTKFNGYDITSVSRRDPQERNKKDPLKALLRKVAPELEAVQIGDRYGVIFSKFDLSCALERQDSVECQGYTREDAARIGINVVLYSLQQ